MLARIIVCLACACAFASQMFASPLDADFESGLPANWSIEGGVWEASDGFIGTAISAGVYPRDDDARLISPVCDLPVLVGPERLMLKFRSAYGYKQSDRASVQIREIGENGTPGAWQTVTVVATSPSTLECPTSWSGWSLVGIDLTIFAGQTVQVGFFHAASSQFGCSESIGWYVDDVSLEIDSALFDGSASFESGFEGWFTDSGVWQVGVPGGGDGSVYATTNRVTHDAYPSDADSRLISPALELPAVQGIDRLVLRILMAYGYCQEDGADVQIRVLQDGLAPGFWETLATPVNVGRTTRCPSRSSGFSPVGVDLTEYAGLTVQIGFLHRADSFHGIGESDGWLIEELSLEIDSAPFDGTTDFESGFEGWTTNSGVWEVGRPIEGYGNESSFAATGTITSDSYQPFTSSRLISPAWQLPNTPGETLLLKFMQVYNYAHSTGARVEARFLDDAENTRWFRIHDIVASPFACALDQEAWNPCGVSIDISEFKGRLVQFGFVHFAGSAAHCSTETGWWIDDITIESRAECLADVNMNGAVEPTDFGAWLAAFNAGSFAADLNRNCEVEPTDFGAFYYSFTAGCE